MKKISYLLISFLIIISNQGYSQIGGTKGYQFLEQPISARIAALGGNVAAINDNDLNIGFVNPSLINSGMDNSLALNYINFFYGN